MIPPGYLKQEQVEFINPRKIEAMEGSVMRIQEYVDEGVSTLYVKDSIVQFDSDILLLNSSECLAMIQGDTTWKMDIDVIEDNTNHFHRMGF